MAVHPLHRQGIRYDASNHQQAFSFPTPTPLNIPPLHPPFFPWPFAQSQPAAFSHVLPFLHRSPSSSIALRRHAAGRAVRAWVPSHSGITLYLLLMISCVMFEGVCDRSSTTLVNDCRTSDAHERVLLCEVIAGVTSLLFVHSLFPLLISPLFFLFEFFPQDKPVFIFLLIFYLVYAS